LVGKVKGLQTLVSGKLENSCEVLLITDDVTPAPLPDVLQAGCLLIETDNSARIIIIIIIIIMQTSIKCETYLESFNKKP
jgi:hypothetical protein